mgnify:CR=1 FL=1|tara:strand:- start:2095 stop:2286 length:192 start_codon:yes stop_codon:yes gene_type:complete
MEKVLLKNEKDLKDVINFFGSEWEKDIKEEIREFPCILISFYANDIEFGEIYRFTAVSINNFN